MRKSGSPTTYKTQHSYPGSQLLLPPHPHSCFTSFLLRKHEWICELDLAKGRWINKEIRKSRFHVLDWKVMPGLSYTKNLIRSIVRGLWSGIEKDLNVYWVNGHDCILSHNTHAWLCGRAGERVNEIENCACMLIPFVSRHFPCTNLVRVDWNSVTSISTSISLGGEWSLNSTAVWRG